MEVFRRAAYNVLAVIALLLVLMSPAEIAAGPMAENAAPPTLFEKAAMAVVKTIRGDIPPDVRIKLQNQNNGNKTKQSDYSYSFYEWAINPRNPTTDEGDLSTVTVVDEDTTTRTTVEEDPTIYPVTTETQNTDASVLNTSKAQTQLVYNITSAENLTSGSLIKESVENNIDRLNQLEDSLENIIKRLYRLEERITEDHQEGTQCPIDYFLVDGLCFFLPKNNVRKATWNKAQQHCKLHGGFLAEPISIQNLRRALLDMSINHDIWLGSTDREREGIWRWSSNSALMGSSKSWYPGEPDNQRENQNCLVMITSNKQTLADRFCWDINHFVCQMK